MRQRFNDSAPAAPASAEKTSPASTAEKETPRERSAVVPIGEPASGQKEAPRAARAAQHTIFEPDASARKAGKFDSAALQEKAGKGHQGESRSAPLPSDAATDQSFFTQMMPAVVNQRHHRLTVVTAILLLAFVGLLILFYFAGKYA